MKKRIENDKDLNLALELLSGGYDPQKLTNPPSFRYFKPDSQQEREARLAMARFLRSGSSLPRGFRECLADLFDPHDGVNDRKLLFRRRARGQPADWRRDRAIALFMNSCVHGGDTVEKAKEKAGDISGLGDETINRIWKRRKSLWNISYAPRSE